MQNKVERVPEASRAVRDALGSQYTVTELADLTYTSSSYIHKLGNATV